MEVAEGQYRATEVAEDHYRTLEVVPSKGTH